VCGKPSAFSIAVGLPLAFAGEAIRAWAVGYSGVTTRGDAVTAPGLVTAGPYAYVRNPLYVGNFITALGFAVAFTGGNGALARTALVGGALGTMLGVYSNVVPHESGICAKPSARSSTNMSPTFRASFRVRRPAAANRARTIRR